MNGKDNTYTDKERVEYYESVYEWVKSRIRPVNEGIIAYDNNDNPIHDLVDRKNAHTRQSDRENT